MNTPNPIAFTIFGLDIRWYGLLIGIAFMIAVLISYKRAPKLGIEPDHVLDVAIFVIPLCIIGARLYYVIFEWDYYKGDISKIIDIRSGGLAIHGGLIVGIIVAFLVCKHHHILLRDILDLFFPQVALGQAIGRWGNYFNSEAHGGPTDLPWAITVDGVKVHPTFLYESIWCLIIFIFLFWLTGKRKFSGQIFLLYAILYSAERFLVEALRTDSLMIGPFKQAQVLSIAVIIVCSALYFILSKKTHVNESSINDVDEDINKGDSDK